MDRRLLMAVALMVLIALAPSLLFKQQQRPAKPEPAAGAPPDTVSRPVPVSGPAATVSAPTRGPAVTGAPAETVGVTSDLYEYRFSTRGARMVGAILRRYQSTAPGERGQPVDLIPPGEDQLAPVLVAGNDTLSLRDWDFTPSAKRLAATGPATLSFSAMRGGVSVELRYQFVPDEYRIQVSGQVHGMGPNGGLLLLSLGSGIRQTEADSTVNHREYGLVTEDRSSHLTRFSSLKPGEAATLSGPFEWVAVKSKYFVTAVLAFDTATARIAGVRAVARPTSAKSPTAAEVTLSLPLGPAGSFAFGVYCGPMEYTLLSRVGHDFDDVNPYGWPGFRTLIRPVAVGVRWLLVWMHVNLHLAYGAVLVIFGILVRLVLWPLNQKAMRASMQMQAIQPLLKDIQERFKNEPQRLQQEMFKLYREHKVNPFGGCWPMLLPMPVLFALFFVFQNTIEFRGASFLWLPDLSRPDPWFILPVVMGLSMFALTKVGQMGMEPNPQAKTMLYVMPSVMTALFIQFASGLNLYYTVSNLASVPQQWLLARERLKRAIPPPPPPAKSKRK